MALRSSSGVRLRILAVELQQIERAQRHRAIVLPMTDAIEHGQAIGVDRDRLAVENARSHWQGGDRLDNEREAIGEVVAVAGDQPHTLAVAVGEDAKAVVLDLVNPPRARWRLLGRPGQTWIEAPDWALASARASRGIEAAF